MKEPTLPSPIPRLSTMMMKDISKSLPTKEASPKVPCDPHLAPVFLHRGFLLPGESVFFVLRSPKCTRDGRSKMDVFLEIVCPNYIEDSTVQFINRAALIDANQFH